MVQASCSSVGPSRPVPTSWPDHAARLAVPYLSGSRPCRPSLRETMLRWLDAIENSHEQARRVDGLSRLPRIVVIDLSMPARVAKHRIRTDEQRSHAVLLSLGRFHVAQRCPGPERPVHQVYAVVVLAEPAELPHPDFDGPHRCENAQLVFLQHELRTRLTLDEGMNTVL